MATRNMTDDLIFSTYAYQPSDILEQKKPLLSLDVPPRPNQPPSAGGILRRLPVELHLEILDFLDLESVLSFSRASSVTRDLAYSHPTFRHLVKWAPGTIVRLRSTGMVSRHSLAVLQRALLAKKCISCRAFGAFLFLTTAQRCCHYCLSHRPQLRLIPADHLTPYFGISESGRSRCEYIAVEYYDEAEQCQKPGQFATYASAISVSVAEHGSLNNIASDMLEKYSSDHGLDSSLYLVVFYLFGAVPAAAGKDFPYDRESALQFERFRKAEYLDRFYVPFPCLTAANYAAFGLWCLGCRDMRKDPSMEDLFPLGFKMTAYLREDFSEHVRHCYGVRQRFDNAEEFERLLGGLTI